MSEGIEKVMVVGAGTMGAGIAELAAKAHCQVRLVDVDAPSLERGRARIDESLARAVEKKKVTEAEAQAAKSRIETSVGFDGCEDVDLAIEAVPEHMELKKKILSDIASRNSNCIIGSNTSSLSLTEIAAAVERPERVIGLHFFNPPPVMPLLEIVRAVQTSEDIVSRCRELAERIGKQPIVVNDVPGFATSRLGVILGLEAMRMLESGVATVPDIDAAMELGYRHPMGPLKLTDLVGLDVRLAIADHLTKEVGPQFRAPPLLRQLVRAGKLGAKTGEGFYRWVDGKPLPK
jgi:3-hydroxybutyryl-CoA dehydrogenase